MTVSMVRRLSLGEEEKVDFLHSETRFLGGVSDKRGPVIGVERGWELAHELHPGLAVLGHVLGGSRAERSARVDPQGVMELPGGMQRELPLPKTQQTQPLAQATLTVFVARL